MDVAANSHRCLRLLHVWFFEEQLFDSIAERAHCPFLEILAGLELRDPPVHLHLNYTATENAVITITSDQRCDSPAKSPCSERPAARRTRPRLANGPDSKCPDILCCLMNWKTHRRRPWVPCGNCLGTCFRWSNGTPRSRAAVRWGNFPHIYLTQLWGSPFRGSCHCRSLLHKRCHWTSLFPAFCCRIHILLWSNNLRLFPLLTHAKRCPWIIHEKKHRRRSTCLLHSHAQTLLRLRNSRH